MNGYDWQNIGVKVQNEFYWPYLDKQVFHVTSVSSFKSILSQEELSPNFGRTAFTFSKSKISYGYKNNYICLFNFTEPKPEKIELMQPQWIHIIAKHNPTILIRLEERKIFDKIIQNSTLGVGYGNPDFMRSNYCIPHVEAWYPEPIKVEKFKDIFEIDWHLRVVKEVCL